MPFLTLDYSANLDAVDVPGLLLRLNQALVDSGQTKEVDIKSRAIRFDTFQVGTSTTDARAFAHVKVSLLSGRTPEIKKDIADRLMAVLKAEAGWPAAMLVQMAVELSDIDRAPFLSFRLGA